MRQMKNIAYKDLSPDQQLAHDEIISLGKGEKLLLEARGGCGKSTVLSIAIKYLLQADEDAEILLIAPTHVAKNTLFQTLCNILSHDELMRCTFQTTAKAIGRFLKKDKETGLQQNAWRPGAFDEMVSYSLIAIDEISATPWKDIRRLYTAPEDATIAEAESYFKALPPIICMGDRIQSRAVREKQSPIFEMADAGELRKIQLTKNHRNEGTIGEFADICREFAKLPVLQDATDDIRIHQCLDKLREDFLQALKIAPSLQDAQLDYAWLSYTNADVAYMALRARQVLYGPQASGDWQIGEYVRVLSGIDNATNGTLLKIVSMNQKNFMFSRGIEIKAHEIALIGDDNQCYSAYLPAYSEIERLKMLIEHCQCEGDKAKALGDFAQATWWWGERNVLQETFAQVQSPLAMTILRSQSRSIRHVWVNCEDVHRFASCKKNILYTAYSRASESLNLSDCSHFLQYELDAYMMFYRSCKALGIPAPSRKRFAKWQEIWQSQGASSFEAYAKGHIDHWLSRKSER